MQKASFDPGLTQQFSAPVDRFINPDGSFNVRRRGSTWRDFHPYLLLINASWPLFLLVLFLGYLVVNTMFAGVYYAVGTEQLQGINEPTAWRRFVETFFFSAHTLTTVGYGSIAPKGMGANIVAALEALTGVLGFAAASALLFARGSRPSGRLAFSEKTFVADSH